MSLVLLIFALLFGSPAADHLSAQRAADAMTAADVYTEVRP